MSASDSIGQDDWDAFVQRARADLLGGKVNPRLELLRGELLQIVKKRELNLFQ